LPDNSILITANMQSETGFPSSHQLKSYVASKSRRKLAARAVLSADAGLLVTISICYFISKFNFKGPSNIEMGYICNFVGYVCNFVKLSKLCH